MARPPTRPLLVRVCGGSLCLLAAWLLFGRAGNTVAAASGARRCDLNTYDTTAVRHLDLTHCNLLALSPSIARFTALEKLDVSHNPALRDLPPLPPSLTTVFALGDGFETVPLAVTALPALRMLSFKSCRLRNVGVAPLPRSLEWLILTDNLLSSLPSGFGDLVRMRKLMLANNRLTSLPESMMRMHELELLRLSNNQLHLVPNWLRTLPKLTWLALAGNPCIESAPARAALPTVRYDELALGAKLGEGTSSVVRKGEWRGQTVAVKQYKAQLSSDGKNLDEVRASCAVDHPNVLRWLGFVEEGANDEARASSAGAGWRLVGLLEWAPGFASLGKPPSMSSVTRDTYPPDARFSGAEIRDIAVGICEALEHLHSRGLAHGDVYAHNILWKHHRGGAFAKLSDFGAAFFYGVGAADGVHYERMEQRAFGFLLEELLERHDGSEPRLLPSVRAAATAATADRAEDRPGFAALRKTLTTTKRGLRPRATFGRVLPHTASDDHGADT